MGSLEENLLQEMSTTRISTCILTGSTWNLEGRQIANQDQINRPQAERHEIWVGGHLSATGTADSEHWIRELQTHESKRKSNQETENRNGSRILEITSGVLMDSSCPHIHARSCKLVDFVKCPYDSSDAREQRRQEPLETATPRPSRSLSWARHLPPHPLL